jgi:hypothetical protein
MLKRRRIVLRASATLSLLSASPNPAAAHAFGARYDLPLPLELYLIGAGAAVGLSFLIMTLFLTKQHAARTVPRVRLRQIPTHLCSVVKTALECLSAGIFCLILATGFFGSDDPTENFAPVMVWIIWWVGLAFVSALIGNLWQLINPWGIIFRWFEWLLERLFQGKLFAGRLHYPGWLGVWPAVLLFLVYAWLELLGVGRSEPAPLAGVILAYSFITWTGMALFGRKIWLDHGEVFTLVFSIFARFAPFETARSGRSPNLFLRPYAVGLLTEKPISASLTILVLSMLSTVAFDGFVETRAWFKVVEWSMLNDTVRQLLNLLELSGPELIVAIKSFTLVAFPLLFLVTYFVFVILVRLAGSLAGGRRMPVGLIAGSFVLSLVPIAIAYHLAHYFLFLLQTGQLIVPLISDPFGFGWNLFGTAAVQMSIDVMNARIAWYLALVAIVLGHVFAVYLAHVMALRIYGTPGAALWSQVPMVVLMVGYTMISLWILSQPIVV